MASKPSPGLYGRYRLATPKNSVVKDSNALRIGILGAANIAPIALTNPAKRDPSIIVVSVAARDEARAKEFAKKNGIPNTHSSYDALIDDPNIDCIYNPLPNGLHYEWTKKALEAGKHVLLEKPAASNAVQTQELFDLAKEKNLVLLEAFHYRFHPASIKFREILQKHISEGHPLQYIKVVQAFPDLFPRTDIRFNYGLAGGIVMDCGCYAVNAVRYFSGLEVNSVEEAVPTIVAEEIDGRMEAVLNLKNPDKSNVKVDLIVSLTNPWLSLRTYREMIPMFTAETDDKIFTFGCYALPGAYHYMSVKDKATGKTKDLPKVYGEGYPTYKYQLDAFVKAVKTGGKDAATKIPGWVTAENSITNMKVIDSIYTKAGMKIRE